MAERMPRRLPNVEYVNGDYVCSVEGLDRRRTRSSCSCTCEDPGSERRRPLVNSVSVVNLVSDSDDESNQGATALLSSSTSLPDKVVSRLKIKTEVEEEPEPLVKAEPKESEEGYDCAICLGRCVHPAKLPCSHVFCWLCLKGVAQASKRCAMCRGPIPPGYLDKPTLLQEPKEDRHKEHEQEAFTWFYQGRNGGWWQYEERMCQELEEMRSNGISRFETLICGALYVIDLYSMVQFKKDRPSQMRRILREVPSQVHVKKGIAGLHA